MKFIINNKSMYKLNSIFFLYFLLDWLEIMNLNIDFFTNLKSKKSF